jgi:3-oxocholest-4-en-26-oate---CoA ligase
LETHFATIWEAVADAVPDHDAVVQGDGRVTWRDYEQRSARLAQAFAEAGLTRDSKVAMFMYNCPEYAETQFAAMKIRAVPVNVNYRYLDDELHYLLDNADAEAVVFHSSLGARIERVRERLPRLRLLVQVDDSEVVGDPVGELFDGVARYEDVIAAHSPAPRIERSSDDVYMFYTGGTTGMPKGVMYTMGDFIGQFLASMPATIGIEPVSGPEGTADAAAAMVASGNAMVAMSGPPLMHGTGAWVGLMAPHLFGATAVLSASRSFDVNDILATVERERVKLLVIVGDAFARPMLRRLEELAAEDALPDLSSLGLIISSGAMFSTEVKQALLDFLPATVLVDALGSTEGTMATNVTMRGLRSDTAAFTAQLTTKVFDDDDCEIEPGSGEVGHVATSGTVPIGYYKDDEKSRSTFRSIGGRWSFPGDLATIDTDGTIRLLGRNSQCINTGGEKVYPEEVEEAIKSHPDVYDCLVFGVDDDRFGQRVVGVASLERDAEATADDVLRFARDRIASYKIPRELTIVDVVPRTLTGKADYPAARNLADADIA